MQSTACVQQRKARFDCGPVWLTDGLFSGKPHCQLRCDLELRVTREAQRAKHSTPLACAQSVSITECLTVEYKW